MRKATNGCIIEIARSDHGLPGKSRHFHIRDPSVLVLDGDLDFRLV